ncbi:MAG: DUF1249 domain-containing protein [Xanthomonadales bacterium]|nr:DUF1249 domain-containing protein [Gammaproteobacteria bacterium]MBT8053703.1 DUF1249 domain-containing protein [Gammaproteobacteria bacterium]NND56058.1 DUF1249 domain-containing protein [Xanthomonadales bacterium]NNK50189.1 DUF1249 domain-containing protein [Xanthomonadales bacterium]
MVSFCQPNGLGKQPALKRLHQVQEEIYRQLHLLLPDEFAYHDSMRSRVAGSPDLRLQVLERHSYTTFFRLTYEFGEGEVRNYAPDAHIRFYHDARIAEATSFNVAQGCSRTAHPSYPVKQILQKAWRRNRALDRWLDYLLQQGHSVATMKAANSALHDGRKEAVLAEIS